MLNIGIEIQYILNYWKIERSVKNLLEVSNIRKITSYKLENLVMHRILKGQ